MKLNRVGPGEYALEGAVTAADAEVIRGEVAAVIGGTDETATFDLTGVVEGNSVMIALMMGWLRDAVHNERRISYRGIPEPLYELIEFYGLDGVLPMNGRTDAA